MAVIDDFALDTTNQVIKHTAGTTVYSTNALYSQIQDWMDNATYMDFTPPMSAQTPTDYTIINGWYLDEGCIEWLKGGAITTSGYANAVYELIFQSSGYTSAVAGDIGKTVTDGATHTGTLLAYDNTARKWWVRKVGTTFANSDALTITTGTGAGTILASSGVFTGEMAFPNIYTLGSIDTTGGDQQIYIVQNRSHVKIWGAGGTADPTPDGTTYQIDVLVKTKEAGQNIDSGNLTVFLRNYPSDGSTGGHMVDLYDNFALTALTGRNAVPLATSADLNNTTATTTVASYSDIKIAFVNGTLTYSAVSGPFTALETVTQATSGATGVFLRQSTTTGSGIMTLGNVTGTFDNSHVITGGSSGATATSSSTLTLTNTTRVITKNFTQQSSYNYSIVIDCATRPLTQVYEYLKYITRQTSTFQTYGLTTPDAVTGGQAATINILDGEQYITALTDTVTAANSYAPVKPAPFGTFAGGKLFGARGVWLQNMAEADIQNFSLIDADGATRTPPNQQALTISNLLSGDAVSVFRTTAGTTINKAVYTSHSTSNTSGASVFEVTTAIASDTPTVGYIRVVRNSVTPATEQRYYYSSWSNSSGYKFTLAGRTDGYGTVLPATLSYTYDGTDRAYVPFIDDKAGVTSVPALSTGSMSTSVIYASDRTLLVRIRRYNGTSDTLIPFETTGTFASNGFSTQAIRTSDSIATTL